MNRLVLLDTNIVYNMAVNYNCMNEVLDVLKNEVIMVSDISLYELTNKSVCLKSIVSNCNIDICRINCLNKGLSYSDIELIKNQIIESGHIDATIYESMKENYKYMMQPIVCILLSKYISLIGPLLDNNSQMRFVRFLTSKKIIKEIKDNSSSILNTIHPKEVKRKVSYYVKRIWKKCIYMYRFEDYNKLVRFKNALKEQNLSDFLGISINSKTGTEMYDIINKQYDKYTFPIFEKKYNVEFSGYIKFLFMKSLIEKSNIDINSLFDALLISSLSYGVILCTDDDKMNQYMITVGKVDPICDKIRKIKQKYD